jgi:hypothetical protein
MTRIIGPTGSRRRRRFLFIPILVIGAAALVLAIAASGGTIGTNAGFEDDDGNLVPNGTAITNCTSVAFDWNCFRPLSWTGTAPYQSSTATANGWAFNGLTDNQKSNTDTGFAGGTKQDDNCASVIGSSAPNKDDLIRGYIGHKTVSVGGTDHQFLELGWVRIPLNTTSSSAHVGFEFNQNQATSPSEPNYAPCASSLPNPPGGSLVQRKAGDLLIVYDFEGSSSGVPTLTFRRWIVAPTATLCEVSGKVPPAGKGCWGPAQPLSASGFAEGKVNSGSTALDCLSPSTDCTNPTTGTKDTLGNAEFGEAGVDLTSAGIFTPGQCLSFGTTELVSRSSGNSGSAAMEDLVGPGRIRISNCGEIKIIKNTDPRGLDQNFGYTSNVSASSSGTCTQGNGNFTLNDKSDQSTGANTQDCTNVPSGGYSVSENTPLPAGFTFESLTCAATGPGTSVSPTSSTTVKTATITLAGDGLVVCTYVNQGQGALQILKESSKLVNGVHPLVKNAGAVFSYDSTSVTDNGATDEDSTIGKVCVSGLAAGSYSVTETTPTSGYGKDSSTQSATVVAGTNCTTSKPTTANSAVFVDPPLYNLQVNFADGGSLETSATIACPALDPADSTTPPSGWDTSKTYNSRNAPATVTCTITVDP